MIRNKDMDQGKFDRFGRGPACDSGAIGGGHGGRGGFTALIIAVAIAVAIALGGVAYILIVKPDLGAIFSGGRNQSVLTGGGQKADATADANVQTTPAQELDKLTIDIPSFDASLSSLPALNVSAFNVSAPSLGGSGMFSGFSVNTNFQYSGDTHINVPEFKLGIQAAAEPPAGGSSGGSSGSSDSSGSTGGGSSGSGSGSGTGGTQPPAQSQVNAANCAQFSQIPAKSYCSMVGDPNGKILCEQCKDAGF